MRISPRVISIVVLAATLATGFSTVLSVQYMRSIGQSPDPIHLGALNGSFWFGWVLLSVPLLALSRGLRIDRAPRIAVPVHVICVLLAAITHVALQSATQATISWGVLMPREAGIVAASWPSEWLRIFPLQLTRLIDWELIAGAAIVAIAHASFYYHETQERALREAQLETRLVEAQLQMLQRQLHPHFLFNTLHAISTLMHRDVGAADRMLAKLGDLLRLTLDSVTRPEVRLSEEMQFIEKYLQIEQVRLGSRLTVRYDVDPRALDALVPALVLQPLVENAIKHGIAPLAGGGRITVAAERQGDSLVMTVDDTGPGPSERGMVALSTGIGVSNTRARLQHQFGASFRFEFQRHAGGFTVLVAIPFRQDPAAVAPAYVA
jgi:signal transduction histidine kinase